MKLRTKVWLIVAASLFLIGAILFVGAMRTMNWDFSKLSTDKLETNRHELTQDFQNISLSTVTADISVLPATDGKAAVICTEWENMKHSVEVKDGTLTVKMEDNRPWYNYIFNLHFASPSITVYLPAEKYGNLTVKAVTGDIVIKDLSPTSMDLSVTTGDIQLTNITCTRISIEGVTGDVAMKNVIAADSIAIEATTGDVKFDACDAAQISIQVTTGDVTGSLLTDKVFDIHVTTGDIDVPPSAGSDKCHITATTGDIRITVK